MSGTHSAALALALAVTALAATGCGSSKSSNSATTAAHNTSTAAAQSQLSQTTTSVLTQAQLIARADPICARVNERLHATSVGSVQDYAIKLPPLAAAERTEAYQLSQLTPPTSMKRDWKRLVESLQTLSTYMTDIAGYADARNIKRAGEFSNRATKTRERVTKIAARYGFKDCSV